MRLLKLLRGQVWTIYKSFRENDNASYDALKKGIISRPNPDTDEDCLAARKQLTHRCLREGIESLDELTQDIEMLLDQSSPGLPAEIHDSELRFHLMRAVPEVTLQLKLLPKGACAQTIA